MAETNDDLAKRLLEAIEAAEQRLFEERKPITGGFRPGGCFCTGECQRNPCHPCNGGIGGAARRPMETGWVCPKCGTVNSPWARTCAGCPPKTPMADCNCPPGGLCQGGLACPRRLVVT